MSYELFIARRYLRSKHNAGIVSVITYMASGGVILGVAALIIMLSVLNGFSGEVKARLIGMHAHVVIKKHFGVAVEHHHIENYQEILDQLAGFPGIEAATPIVESKMIIARKDGDIDGVVVWGVDSETFSRVSDLPQHLYDADQGLVLGKIEGFKHPGIVLGEQLSRALRAGPGDDILLITLQDKMVDDIISGIASGVGLMPKLNGFFITDTFESGMWQYDDGFAFISLADAQHIIGFKENEITQIHVKVADIEQATEIRQQLDDAIGYPYKFNDWTSLFPQLFQWMEMEKWLGFIALSLIIVVAAFNITSILVMSILIKTPEIGILKTMGATIQDIRRIFLYQGMVIGVVGTVLGGIVGFVLCYAQQHFQLISLPGDVYWINSLPVDMQLLDFLAVAAMSLGTCLLASVYPARKASSLLPVEAIRYII